MKKFGKVYFSVFGVVVLVFGVLEFILSVTGRSFPITLLETPGEFLWWRGIILLSSGLLYLSSIRNFSEIHQLAKATTASIMVWIVAGVSMWAKIASSIPGGEEGGWFIPKVSELKALWTSYSPSLFLLPFSLVIIYYVRRFKLTEEQ